MNETLPWAWYSDPELLAAERRRIFARSWQYIGHTGEVGRPGDHTASAAGHVPVALVRDEDGTVRAFLNVCRHRGHEVVSGRGNRRSLQCPYHAWTYGLDGSLLKAPRSEQEPGFDAEGLSLVPLRLETWGPLVFVNPDPDAPPLAKTLEGVPTALAEGGIDVRSLVFRRRLDYALDANWKVVIENYLECYHCPVAHPGFSKEVDVDPDSYVLAEGTRTSSQYARSKDGDGRGQFHFVWPNIRVNVFPGPPNLSIGPALPLGPERTAGFFDYFFAAGTGDAEVEELIAFDGQVSREDRALVESVQRGVASGLLAEGRLLPESERLVAHFQRLVHESLYE
jgi:phenylpropionate dioxygenase-like ring-hydroxylating dioxygenase large terminal subunit